MDCRKINQNYSPTISDGRDTEAGNIPLVELFANGVGSGSSAVTGGESPPIVQCDPLFNTVISPFPTTNNISIDASLDCDSDVISEPSILDNLINVSSEVLLYQHPSRLYTNGWCFERQAKKNYSPHDSIESYHNWSKREYEVLVKINKRIGTVSLVLRFHYYLTKQEYAFLLSRLKKELKLLRIEWIAFGDVTSSGLGFPINRLHFHFAFDTKISPEAMGTKFQSACERAFYRLVRPSDFQTVAEYQAAIVRRYMKHKVLPLQYGKDFSITGKQYVTDDNGSWERFVRYVLKYQYAPYGIDPVPKYFSDGDIKNGHPLVRLFWKYKNGSGARSLPRIFYSSTWFVGSSHQEQIKRYKTEQKLKALSFSLLNFEPPIFDNFLNFAPID